MRTTTHIVSQSAPAAESFARGKPTFRETFDPSPKSETGRTASDLMADARRAIERADAALDRCAALASPIHLGCPAQTMAETVETEASYFRSWDSDLGALIAETLGNLARGIRSVQARTPDQYRERVETVERDQQYDDWHRAEEQGYQRGLREGGLL